MNIYPYGHLINYIARRIPITNGFLFHEGLNPSEKFFIAQEENKAKEILNNFNVKYIILDYYSINAIQYMAARLDNKNNYVREIKLADNKKQKIYTPKYYKSISTRLYLHNGKEYTPKESYVLINNKIRKFNSYKSALDYIKKHNNSIIIGIDPYESPIPLEPLETDGYQLVYESNTTIAKNSFGEIKKVKIFRYEEESLIE
jgi:asparagine N-glycosylation enzyme membrane subunit Stt3